MIGKKILFSGLILLLLVYNGLTQIVGNREYVIITFEVNQKKPKMSQLFYWIIPVDSIEEKTYLRLYPLYIEKYSHDNYQRCLKGDSVDIFTATTETKFDFSEDYLIQIEVFQSIVKQKRKLVQTLILNWKNKNKGKEKINVYITPIKGEFCRCVQLTDVRGKPYLNFIAQVFMPSSSFSYNYDFWDTEKGNIIQFTDFSKMDYSSHIPLDIYGRYVLKARPVINLIND